MKINVFFELDTSGGLRANPMQLWVSKERIEAIAQKVFDVVAQMREDPKKEQATLHTLGFMADNLLADPKNVQLVMDQISASDNISSSDRSTAMSEVMWIHADTIRNPALSARLRVLNSWFENNVNSIHENTNALLEWIKYNFSATSI